MRAGWTPSDELMNDGLREWYTFYDFLNGNRTAQYSIPDYVYPVTGPGSQTNGNGYEVGPTAADWVGPRPVSIARANLVQTNMGPQPVYIQLRNVSMEAWADLAIQQIPGIDITSIYYYDPQYPNGVFNVFPPLTGNSIQLYTWGFLTPPPSLGQANYTTITAALATAFLQPPMYADMTIWELASRLLPLVPKVAVVKPVSVEYLNGKAYASLQEVKRVNRPVPILATDAPSDRANGANGYYDSFVTYTGEPY